ncbi:MAG: hypothetical protein H6824_23830 [Planctomycetaceae bacterium]|nr:hypothetical protein [Planctomycetaceae bacterium]
MLSGLLLAAEPANELAKKAKATSVEERLQARADLDFGEAETISFGDLLSQIQQEHGVLVRLDRASAMQMSLTLSEGLVSKDDLAQIPQKKSQESKTNSQPLFVVQSVATYQQPAAACPTCQPGQLQVPLYSGSPVPPMAGAAVIQPAPVDPYTPVVRPVTPVYPVSNEESVPSLQVVESPATQSIEVVDPPIAKVESPAAEANEEAEETTEAVDGSGVHALGVYESVFRKSEVQVALLQGEDLTVEQVLRAALGQVSTYLEVEGGEDLAMFPASYTHAYDWDLMTKDGCVLITTRLQANLNKVARVYRLPKDSDLSPEEVALVIRKSVRPWSWLDEIDDVVNMVQMDLPPAALFQSLPKIKNINLTGNGHLVEFASAEEGEEASENEGTDEEETNPAVAIASLKAIGSLMSTSTIAAAHTAVNTTEMLHFADPPTATMQVLPGMLVITQSQSAHREIEELFRDITQSDE